MLFPTASLYEVMLSSNNFRQILVKFQVVQYKDSTVTL